MNKDFKDILTIPPVWWTNTIPVAHLPSSAVCHSLRPLVLQPHHVSLLISLATVAQRPPRLPGEPSAYCSCFPTLCCHLTATPSCHWSRYPVTSLLPCEGAFGRPLTWPFGSRAPDHSSLYGLETAPSPRLSCRPRCSSQPALPAPVLSLSLCGCSWGSALNSFPCFPSLKGPPAAGSLAPQIPSSSTWIPEWNGFPRLMCTSLDRP